MLAGLEEGHYGRKMAGVKALGMGVLLVSSREFLCDQSLVTERVLGTRWSARSPRDGATRGKVSGSSEYNKTLHM